ncbi:hypothetical protein T03_16612, partial [Trichinella britovi]
LPYCVSDTLLSDKWKIFLKLNFIYLIYAQETFFINRVCLFLKLLTLFNIFLFLDRKFFIVSVFIRHSVIRECIFGNFAKGHAIRFLYNSYTGVQRVRMSSSLSVP